MTYSDNQSSHDDGFDWGERWREGRERQDDEHDEMIHLDQAGLQEQLGEMEELA